MNKKIIISTMILFVMLFTVVENVSADTLRLVAKNSSYYEVPINGNATLTYSPLGNTFDYSLIGTVPLENMNYGLIYYKDKVDQYGDWGHVGAIIGNVTSDSNRNIIKSGSADIGSIPYLDDANNITGAKIWLVPLENIDVVNMTMFPKWNPNNYLFEENLRYANGTQVPGTSHLIRYTKTLPTKLNTNVSGVGYITTKQWNISIPVNATYSISIPYNETATFGFNVRNTNGTTIGYITYQQIGLNDRTNIFGNVTSSNIDINNKTVTFSGIATLNGFGSYPYSVSTIDNKTFSITVPSLNYTIPSGTNVNNGIVIYEKN